KSAQIREILISESAWEEMTCLFAPSQAELKYWFIFSYIKVTYLHYDLMFDSFKSHNHILNHDVPFLC
ncbi:hypothetical protein B8031_20105, partial [Klebsiella pneumoniae]